MSWKKNVFSNLMWSAYTLLTVVGLVELSGAAVRIFRGPSYMGLVVAVIVAALAAACVYIFHKFAPRLMEAGQRKGGRLVLVEYALMAFFLIVGLMLRVSDMSGAGNGGEYYDAAMVAAGHSVPQVVHGAVYFHLRLLHLVFLVVGNKVAAGIWIQVILQLLAGVLAYFGVKKLAGVIPAQITLLFFMFAEPMVQSSVVLSPEPLYLLMLSVGIFILAMCRTKPDLIILFLPAGLWTGLMGYLDISGFFLLLLAAALILEDWDEDTSLKERGAAIGLCLAGTMAGFLVSMLLDSLLSGKSFVRIMNAWQALYGQGPAGFSASSLADGLYWEGPLLLLMSFGVISYWRDRERQYISMWMLMLCIVALLRYGGMLTNEMPPTMYMILCLSVLAGVGIRASFYNDNMAVAGFVSQQIKEPIKVMEEEYEEEYEVDDIAPMKLPKYLQEPESGEIKIPKYLQEEAETAKPKPQPAPVAASVVSESVEPEPSVTESAHNYVVNKAEAFIFESEEPEPPVTESANNYVVNKAEAFIFESEEPAPPVTKSTDRYVVSELEEEYVEVIREKAPIQEDNVPPEPLSSAAEPMEEVLWEEEIIETEHPKETTASIAAAAPIAAANSAEELWPSVEPVSSKPQYIENPLPLPKPHEKRVMEYNMRVSNDEDDYDYPVADDDDFDIQ